MGSGRLVPGRIVRYYIGDRAVPAIITRVWSERCVNLAVFTDSDAPPVAFKTSVAQVTPEVEATGNLAARDGQWEWPGTGQDGRQERKAEQT